MRRTANRYDIFTKAYINFGSPTCPPTRTSVCLRHTEVRFFTGIAHAQDTFSVIFYPLPLDISYCCDIILISSLEVLFMEEKIITGHKNGMLVLLLELVLYIAAVVFLIVGINAGFLPLIILCVILLLLG